MNYTSEVIEIIIREGSGMKIEQHKINIHNKKAYWKIITYIEDKYGLGRKDVDDDVLFGDNVWVE